MSKSVLITSAVVNSVTDDTKCPFCEMTLKNRFCLVSHCNRKHPKDIKKNGNKCPKCPKYFFDRILKHHCSGNGNRIECSFCSVIFVKRYNMVRHCRKKHPNDIKKTWLQCKACQLYCIDNMNLKKHSEQHVPVQVSENLDKKDERIKVNQGDAVSDSEGSMKNSSTHQYDSHTSTCIDNGNASFIKCEFCPINFIRNDNNCCQKYVDHANQEHREKVSTNWIKCLSCDFHAPDQNSIDDHEQQCYNPGVCIQCDAICTKIDTHKCHTQQNVDISVQCDLCYDYFESTVLLEHKVNCMINSLM
jgi:hypothetical protein